MRENHDLTEKGFDILHVVMSDYIYKYMKLQYKSNWWTEVKNVLYKYLDDIPSYGDDEYLRRALDRANCIRVLSGKWKDLFSNYIAHPEHSQQISCSNWIKEMMGVRNALAHDNLNDISLHDAERALDTMILICDELCPSKTSEIREIYDKIRAKSINKDLPKEENVDYIYPQQTVSMSDDKSGVNLFNLIGTEWVQKTGISKKITIDKKTASYPVYRIALDEVFYNDQNDRIATWISKYKAENGEDSLVNLAVDKEEYNDIVEEFIYNSNPEAIRKTQTNIAAVDQREPGVVLSDGRIVDGNRRFTCLRRLQREKGEQYYFEAVILDIDVNKDKKQIKLLELALQHGEEKKVDYDLIDYAIGTYNDIEKTHLLTVEEYAEFAGETKGEVRKRLTIAGIISEFLEYIKLPGQYYIAREFQVYSLFDEMLAPLNLLSTEEEKNKLKMIAFNNALMHAVADQRKFIRDIKTIVKSGKYSEYFAEKVRINKEIHDLFDSYEVSSKRDIEVFANDNSDIAEEMRKAIENALLSLRKSSVKAKPIENVSKCISLIGEIDASLIKTLSDSEKAALIAEMNKLIANVELYKGSIE